MASSIASQWMPIPPPIGSQSFRCRAVAASSRGNHANGTETVRPSSSTTVSESSEHDTSAANTSLLTLGQPTTRTRNRDEDDARTVGYGPGNDRQGSDGHGRDCHHDARWAERDRDDRERDRDGRDAFTRHLNLRPGPERELVRDRDREYTVRGSESRTLATAGAFRVVSSRDLRDHDGSPADPRSGDLRQGHASIARSSERSTCPGMT
jgi:hypothetical protein